MGVRGIDVGTSRAYLPSVLGRDVKQLTPTTADNTADTDSDALWAELDALEAVAV